MAADLALIGGAGAVYKFVLNPDQLGQVIFTTEDQSTATSYQNCKIPNQVKTVKVGTPVWAVYMLKHRVGADQVVVGEVFKDDVSLGTFDLEPGQATKADCLSDTSDLSELFDAPGTIEIRITVGTEVLADGKLTITP